MMKRILSLFLAALLATLLTACGGSAGGNGGGRDSMTAGSAGADSWDFDSSFAEDEGFNNGLFDAAAPSAPTQTPSAPTEAPSEPAEGGRKVIYTADIRLEATDFDAASRAMGELVEAHGGYFESRSVSNYDAFRSGSYTVRVPAAQFEAFCAGVGQICHVVDLHTGEENVSEAYYDIEARLTTQRTKLERLQKLLSEAETMADIITIESAISDTELEIEYLTGSLRHYDALIDYATVTVYLQEVYRLSNTPEPPLSFGGRIVGALHSGLDGAVTAFEEVVVLLAHIWVLLLAAAAAAAVWLALRRRRRKRAAQEPSEQEEKR